jgi:uncharacterized protein YbaP (TraB family)
MDLLNKLVDFYSSNKDAIQLAVALIVYIFAHRQAAFSYVKKQASLLMLSAEKGSEQLLLTSGSQKMDWVVQQAYNKMPSAFRMIISLDTFRKEAQKVFNKATQFITEQQAVVPSGQPTVVQPQTPVVQPLTVTGTANFPAVPTTPAVTPTPPEQATQIKVDEKP